MISVHGLRRVAAARSLVVLATIASAAAAQQVYFVDAHSPPNGDCLAWSTACRDLQVALDLAGSGDQVWIADGVYRPSVETVVGDPRSVTFVLPSGVALYGGFGGGEATLEERNPVLHEVRLTGDLLGDDGMGPGHTVDNAYHVMETSGVSADTVVDGVTLLRGAADGACCVHDRGGAVFNDGGSPTFLGCSFRLNDALIGGAVASALGHAKFERCSFSGNRAGSGGAIYLAIDTDATLQGCTFTNNSAEVHGGAVEFHQGGAPVVNDCVFESNSAALGGAMFEDESEAVISDCRFEQNRALSPGGAGRGGAVHGGGEPGAKFVRCTFIGNSANGEGGAARIGGRQDFSHCEFLGNRGDLRGGAIHLDGTDPLVHNCLFSGNVTEGFGGAISLNASGLYVERSTFSRNEALPIDDSGNCCVEHATAGCTDMTCEAAVCEQDRFCCDNEWDETCRARAGELVQCDCGGDPGFAGGIYVANESSLSVTESILWRNRESAGIDETAQIASDGTGTISVRYSCLQGLTGMLGGVGNVGDNPSFVSSRGPDGTPGTQDDNLRLNVDSPVINAGDPDREKQPGEVDLDGRPRVVCERVDMGAYEFGFGDLGCDLTIGLAEFAVMSSCFSGPGGVVGDECSVFDSVIDHDVDLGDLAAFQNLFNSDAGP